jgi:hypothetical protein
MSDDNQNQQSENPAPTKPAVAAIETESDQRVHEVEAPFSESGRARILEKWTKRGPSPSQDQSRLV